MTSILQTDKRCWFCPCENGLEKHHVFAGVANRKLSEKYGLWVWVCHEHHTGKNGVQYDPEKGRELKRYAQGVFEITHSHAEWMKVFRKNYL